MILFYVKICLICFPSLAEILHAYNQLFAPSNIQCHSCLFRFQHLKMPVDVSAAIHDAHDRNRAVLVRRDVEYFIH